MTSELRGKGRLHVFGPDKGGGGPKCRNKCKQTSYVHSPCGIITHHCAHDELTPSTPAPPSSLPWRFAGIGGTRFISFEGRHWHNDCFLCSSCKTSMVGKGFITDNEDILCPECAKKRLMADAVEQ